MTTDPKRKPAREELEELIFDAEGDICDLPRIIKGLKAAALPDEDLTPWQDCASALFNAAACHAEHVKAHYYRIFDANKRVREEEPS